MNKQRSIHVSVSSANNPPHHHRHLRRRERICSELLTNRTSIPASLDGEIPLRSPPSEWRKKMISDNALLIIDMQQGLFRAGLTLFRRCRSGKYPFVNSKRAPRSGTRLFCPPCWTRRLPLLREGAVNAADTRAGREGAGCCFHQAPSQLFSDTELLRELNQRGIKQLVIAGMKNRILCRHNLPGRAGAGLQDDIDFRCAYHNG